MDNQLEDDSLRDREPVKLFQNGGDRREFLDSVTMLAEVFWRHQDDILLDIFSPIELKQEAEAPETEAKDAHKKLWEAQLELLKATKEKQKTSDAFDELDLDGNGR